MIVDFITAGATLRRKTAALFADARSSMSESRERCRIAEVDARAVLEELDAQRRRVAGDLVTAYPLYRLAGLRNPGLAAEGDSGRLQAMAFDETSLPASPSSSVWLAAGALGGAASGAALILAGGFPDPAAWAAGIVGGAVAGLVISGLTHARKTLAVACQHLALAQQWRERASAHVLGIEEIRRGAMLSMQLCAAHELRVRSRQLELEDIALDTTNAAKLLKDVLNTALLNEEGAFLEDVIEQLHGQKERIAGFAGQIAVET